MNSTRCGNDYTYNIMISISTIEPETKMWSRRSAAIPGDAPRTSKLTQAARTVASALFGICVFLPVLGNCQPGIPFRSPFNGFHQVAIAIQADGKIIVGGYFNSVQGVSRDDLVRLLPNGSVDASYAPESLGNVRSLAIQPDGQLLVAETRNNCVTRLGLSGIRDPGFQSTVGGSIRNMALQPDRKILLQGSLQLPSPIGGSSPIARLNTDGSLDEDFMSRIRENKIQSMSAMCIRGDGTLYIGGVRRAGSVSDYLSHFDSLGNLITNVYRDRGIEVLLPEQERTLIFEFAGSLRARLNSDGSPDPTFRPRAGSHISVAFQSDGKLVVGGDVSPGLNARFNTAVARLMPDGRFDSSFPDVSPFPSLSAEISSVAVEPDGSVLYASSVGRFLERLPNPTPAYESLEITGSTVVWKRGGSAPLAQYVNFARSVNGVDWSPIGNGQLTPQGWTVSVPGLLPGETVRARGTVLNSGSDGGVSQWFVEAEARAGAPAILRHPANRTNHLGGPVAFSSAVSGSGPLTFQWLKDGTPLPGASEVGLGIPAAAAADAGLYSLVASNAFGSVTSAPARLELTSTPAFVRQPYNQFQHPGSNATLTVTVSGAPPFSYQWSKDGSVLDGATNASLTLTGLKAADEGTYQVLVQNQYGVASSAPAVVKLVNPPQLTIQSRQGRVIVVAEFESLLSPTCTLQTSTNLIDWEDRYHTPVGLGANFTLTIEVGPAPPGTNLVTDPVRFFRTVTE